jgi:HK97 gp10 family phage protein
MSKIRLDASDFLRKIRNLQTSVRATMLADAVQAGGLVIEEQAKENAPYRTGTLRRSIGTTVTGSSLKAEARVGPAANVPYAAITEFGGVIEPKNAPRLAWKDDQGKWHLAKRVVRKPRPFLRPAFDNRKAAALDTIRKVLAFSIERAWK